MKTLDELMADEEVALLERTRRELAIENLPENVAKREAKRKEEFERGVRLGWHDADGNPIVQDDEADEADDDEEQPEDEDEA